jgi:CO/xanthine dehydrogenase FAD-binding subunit
MSLPAFSLLRPKTLSEALDQMADHPGAFPIAGGTNLIVDARAGKLVPETVVQIGHLKELRTIETTGNEMILGGAVTIGELLRDVRIEQEVPVLHAACKTFANALIRNRATIGGNLVNNAPCADTAPALLVLDADVELMSLMGTRRLPLIEFLKSPFITGRQGNELLTSVRFRIPPKTAIGKFRKMGLRKISCMAKVDVALLLDVDEHGGCRKASIALGAASPVAMRAQSAEAILTGHPLRDDVIRRASEEAARTAAPRSGSEYKQRVVAGLVRRLLSEISSEVGARDD